MPAAVFVARSITELLAIRARDQSDEPYIYTGGGKETGITSGSLTELRSLTFSETQKAVDRLAWHYESTGIMPEAPAGSVPPVRIIAVLTSSAIDESLLEIALAKIGLTALLLSVNNSVPAVAHLIKLTKSTHLIYGDKFVKEAAEAQAFLGSQGYEIGLVPDKRFPLWGPDGVANVVVKPFKAVLTPSQESDRPGVILHSSGSTGFPKPVYVSHYGLIANIAINQNHPGFSTLPVYHGYGHFAIFRCLYPGRPITLFPPHLPLTSANICAILAASPPVRQCFAVPYVIKLLGETPEGINALASFDVVGFAGAPLPDDLGDRLVAAGVNLLSIYGATEAGSLMNSSRPYATDKAWNWVRPVPGIRDYLVMEPRGGNTFEVVVKDGYPPKVETNRPDGSFATKDLFLRHPENPNWYKYIGRLDDTLVHILGEKTNPVPMELAIRGNSPYVAEAIVFGAGKPQTGVLILPSDIAIGLSKNELMEKIWPIIEQANADAPTHSRILPEMIEFLPYGTHVPVASKMSILRPACYAKFKDIIEQAYEKFEQGGEDLEKLHLSGTLLEGYIFKVIAKTLGPIKSASLTKDVDLFAFGVDSLQGTRVRNALQKELDLSGQTLGQNIVYEYPSIVKLAKYIEAIQSGAIDAGSSNHVEKMLTMLGKWTGKLIAHETASEALPKPLNEKVVVLTGATGSLGAHILHQLTLSPVVRKVICLSRANSHEESMQRLKESMRLRRLAFDHIEKVQSFAANANAPFLGLLEAEYEAIRKEVTDIIHNAWPVNFVLSIESYDEHIGGALNLMNLCLSSPYAEPASFFFSSSISARQGAPEHGCVEDFPPSPLSAGGTGYAQSKWVVEKLCQNAGEKVKLPVGVLRIGQMTGDSLHGVWNETEAWPLMFKSANTLRVLPSVNEHPSWLPVDYAGRGITEIVVGAKTHHEGSQVYHIVNPDTATSWNQMLDALHSAGLEFEKVKAMDWVEKLRTSESDPAKNPTIKLLSFFHTRYSGTRRQPMVFETTKTAKVAPSVGGAPGINPDIVGKWVARWKETGFLN
ncbi:L-aminoadipate-semialdehyde dehydrogenase [Collybia nuda]|uniref:L-aminoadipate-semialdehyde dehydrogenase n=1 Tax=Collybia nuda TaxID=64659 RepID=A0A9P5XY39_9AGAR|nr:L-aminoadipate-semialdehyde dehydrogenase [Collybia nuda]